MTYVDGFLLPVPENNLETYRVMSESAGRVWIEYGALSYVECVADDLESEQAKGFKEASLSQKGETTIFAFITYRSREHRDEVNKKVMADSRIKEACPAHNPNVQLPFDMSRMAYGGFRAIVDL